MADFVWRVSRSGYKWTMIDREGTPRYDTLATDQSAEFREYRPMDVEGLFLRFADLDEKDPEAWLAFANEYGHLTAGVCVTDQDDQECECDLADRLRWPNGDDLPFVRDDAHLGLLVAWFHFHTAPIFLRCPSTRSASADTSSASCDSGMA